MPSRNTGAASGGNKKYRRLSDELQLRIDKLHRDDDASVADDALDRRAVRALRDGSFERISAMPGRVARMRARHRGTVAPRAPTEASATE